MNTCLFVSDLHGKMSRYEALLKIIKKEKPDFVFLGGDLLPHKSNPSANNSSEESNFIKDFLIPKFNQLKEKMDCAYPEVFLIPGNDDRKLIFNSINEGEKIDLWRNIHNKCIVYGKYRFYGYAFVPPTPFMIKDWEKFDVSLSVDEGCISPTDGVFSLPPDFNKETDTIETDMQSLVDEDDIEFGVFLFHSPPFQTVLDMAGIKSENECSNVGSKAIRNFIDTKQPFITMHGHIHESARLTGEWKQSLGRTQSFSAAHDGLELAVVKFELHNPIQATRRIIKL